MSNASFPSPTPMNAPKKRRAIWPFVLIGLAIVLIGGGAAAYAVAGRYFQAQRNTPALVSADTQVYASVNPNLSALPGFQRLQQAYTANDPEAQADAEKQLEDLLGLNFKNDIQPWIGLEIAVAVDGLDALDPMMGDPTQITDANVTILLASRDNAKAQAALDKFRSAREAEGESFATEEYKGIAVTVGNDDEDAPGAYAIVRDNVVIASDAQAIKNVIDRAESGENTLAQSPAYAETMKSLPATAVGYVYISGAAMNSVTESGLEQQEAMLTSMGSNPFQKQIDQQREVMGALQGLGIAVSVPEDGVAFDTAIKWDMSKLSDATKAQFAASRAELSDTMIRSVSKDALAVYAMPIPDTFRAQIADLINGSPEIRQQVAEMEDQLSISVEKDILSWISGEVAFVLTPADVDADMLPMSGYIALRSKDQEAARQGLPKIADVLGMMGGMPFEEQELNGVTWQTVSDPMNNKPFGGYTFIDDAVIFGVMEPGMRAAATASTSSLADDDMFKTAQGKAFSPGGALFYVDVPDAVKAGVASNGQSQSDFDASASGKGLKPIQSVILSGEPGVSDDGTMRGRLFVAISAE